MANCVKDMPQNDRAGAEEGSAGAVTEGFCEWVITCLFSIFAFIRM